MPVSKEDVFFTVVDNQPEVNVEIYQGEASLVIDNIFIGDFLIENLTKAPAGNPILLNLELDVNGILKVTAKEKNTGLSKTVKMDASKHNNVFDLEQGQKNIASVLEGEEKKYTLDETADSADKQALMSKAKSLRKRAEGLLSSVNEEDAAELRGLLEQNLQAIARREWETLSDLNESLSDMLFYLED